MTTRSKIALQHLLGWVFIGSLLVGIAAVSCNVTYETSLSVSPVEDTLEVEQ